MRSTLAIRAAVSLAVSGLAFAAGCGALGSGPLRSLTAGGQTVVDASGAPVVRGEPAATTVWVYNSAPGPVTLESASLMPVRGYPVGRLAHVAVATTHDYIVGGHGWPPGVPIEPLQGAAIAHGEHGIVFGITGAKAGRDYMDAGLTIVYRYRGSQYTTRAWGLLFACVVPGTKITQKTRYPPTCQAKWNKAWAKVRREAGDS